MTYDSDRHGSWQFDDAYAKSVEQEPTYASTVRSRPPMNENGSVRAAFVRCTQASHEAAKSDPVQWGVMKSIGIMPVLDESADDDTVRAVLELRNCPDCHSTLGKELPASDAALALLRERGLL